MASVSLTKCFETCGCCFNSMVVLQAMQVTREWKGCLWLSGLGNSSFFFFFYQISFCINSGIENKVENIWASFFLSLFVYSVQEWVRSNKSRSRNTENVPKYLSKGKQSVGKPEAEEKEKLKKLLSILLHTAHVVCIQNIWSNNRKRWR